MSYKGFDIIKRSAGLFWVICSGFMIGSATTIEGAQELIDEFIYQGY